MNFRQRARPDPVGFQLAPMIDIVFLLLCFFVASQLFAQWESEIDIQLPTAKSAATPQRLPGEIILNVRADGTVVVSGRSFDADGLDRLLAQLVEIYPGQPVVIRADRATPYQHVIAVIDACRRAEIWNIAFATALPE